MRRSIVIAAAAWTSLACHRIEDAAPRLVSVETTNLQAGAEVDPYATVAVEITGTELWLRPVTIIVEHRLPSSTQALEALNASFDEGRETQKASAQWIVRGSILERAGRNEVIFRASAESVELASSPIFVEINPQIESVELTSHSAGERVQRGQMLTARLTGTHLWSREVEVDVVRRDQQGALETLETIQATFNGDRDLQIAGVSWRVDGDFLERAGTSELFFRAQLEEQMVSSDAVSVDVQSGILAIRVFHEHGMRKTEIEPQGGVPAIGLLTLEAVTMGLVGQQATIAVFRQGSTTPIDSTTQMLTQNLITGSFPLGSLDFGGAESVTLYFRISIGPLLLDSPVVRVDRRGFLGCGWIGDAGVELPARAVVSNGQDVTLRAELFGLDGMAAIFEIWESDGAAGNDFVALFRAQAEASAVDAAWTAVYLDDGALQTEAEYYFTIEVAEYSCASPIMVVRK